MVSVKTTALELPFFFILKRQYTEQLADRQADQFTDDSNQLKHPTPNTPKEDIIMTTKGQGKKKITAAIENSCKEQEERIEKEFEKKMTKLQNRYASSNMPIEEQKRKLRLETQKFLQKQIKKNRFRLRVSSLVYSLTWRSHLGRLIRSLKP